MYQKIKELGNNIIKIATEKELDTITCNCALASILMDHPEFMSQPSNKLLPREIQYCVGGLKDIELMVDSNMKYTDLRILDYKGEIVYDYTGLINTTDYL